MSALHGKAAKAFTGMGYLKFAATVNNEGMPNVIPLLSARMVDAETIAFVRFMVWKTARNFEQNGKITFACMGPGARSYMAKGKFKEWMSHGPLLEEFEREPIYRYNAYSGANTLGIVRVREVLDYPGGSFLLPFMTSFRARAGSGKGTMAAMARMLGGKGRKPAGNDGGPMPWQVVEKWGRPLAVKFIGFLDEQGGPAALPLQGISAPDSRTLTFPLPADPAHPLRRIEKGARIAASVLAFDPSAYQAKGVFTGSEKRGSRDTGVIEVSEVYAASPPLPGKRIFPAEADDGAG